MPAPTDTSILNDAIALATFYGTAPHAFDASVEDRALSFRSTSPLYGARITIPFVEGLTLTGFDNPDDAAKWEAVVIEAIAEAAK